MKKLTYLAIVLTFSFSAYAGTNFVSKTGNNIPPYDSWAKAARSIQLAVYEAEPGNVVLVNDGTYTPALAVEIVKEIIVKSVNGSEKTIIDGSGIHRCFSLIISNPALEIASIDGFTMTNGYLLNTGAAYCINGTIQNCNITGNSSSLNAGGLFVAGGKILNCVIRNNRSGAWGGGISYQVWRTVMDKY